MTTTRNMLSREEIDKAVKKHGLPKLFVQVCHGHKPERLLIVKDGNNQDHLEQKLGRVPLNIFSWYERSPFTEHPSNRLANTSCWNIKERVPHEQPNITN